MLIDLHIHTIATPHHSFWEPEALVAAAKTAGIAVIAVSDHNTTASVAAVQAVGAAAGVRVISGVELDTAFAGKLWHTHLYNVDPAAPAVQALCTAVVERNRADAQALAASMRAQGHRLPWLEEVEAQRAPNLADVAHALVKAEVWPREAGVEDEAAGMAYLLRHQPAAYNPLSVAEVIAVANELGGLAILAHPGRSKSVYAIPADAADIAALAAAGLHGLEVYYPTHTPEQVAFFREQAGKHQLLITAGSDSHGPRDGLRGVDAQLCQEFLQTVDLKI